MKSKLHRAGIEKQLRDVPGKRGIQLALLFLITAVWNDCECVKQRFALANQTLHLHLRLNFAGCASWSVKKIATKTKSTSCPQRITLAFFGNKLISIYETTDRSAAKSRYEGGEPCWLSVKRRASISQQERQFETCMTRSKRRSVHLNL